ncbi:class C beta-lactamase [Devosia sediminis]|uniref:Beta-lactamase n=1 Tax=Devosia sediminis TaxID=2798801 RepID=A0A934IZ98_9HYPH|nr:class C beta-lactamase [Devosia sediminis]MBJ3785845.1 beta-lactamase [Devosia sediminis]
MAIWTVCVSLSVAQPAALADIVERHAAPLLDEHDVPGLAVAVTVGGEAYFFNYGVASLEGGEPVTENTIFEIGSVSKIFTSMLGTYAEATGALSLTDHPGRYVPELSGRPLDEATLLNLATYTAGGLPLQFPATVGTNADAPNFYADFETTAEPGQQRRYSNPSIGLFGFATARALDDTFSNLVQQALFGPLGLDDSFIAVPAEAMDRYAWGHDRDNNAIRVNPGVLDAEAYGVKSTSADMIRLVEAHIRPDTLDGVLRQTVEATQIGYFRVGTMVQGIGWEQYPFPLPLDDLLAGNSQTMAMEPNAASELVPPQMASGPTLFNKTGSTGGFGAYVAFVPAEEIGVVILANKNYPIPARVTAAHGILTEIAETRAAW